MEDKLVLAQIMKLVEEEERLYTKEDLDELDIKSLHKMKIELDQCWDYLNQRRALREAGENPDKAQVRAPGTVEGYEQ
jgi:hypothetical protein